MKFIILNVILLLIIVMVDCQPMYINFVPYANGNCDQNGELPFGVGFSILANECVNDIVGVPGTTESTKNSWFLDTDDTIMNPSITVKLTKDSDKSHCDKETYKFQELYLNSTCIQTPDFANLNGTIVGLEPNQYSIISKTYGPIYPNKAIVYSVFQNGDCDFGQLYYSMYLTDNVIIKSLDYSQQFTCKDSSSAYIINCNDSSNGNTCKVDQIPDICTSNKFGNEITFCSANNNTIITKTSTI